MDQKERSREEISSVISTSSGFELDVDAYAAEVEDFDMTEDQKRELLVTLWSIMRSFVEMGFSGDICAALFDCDGNSPPEGVNSKHTETTKETPSVRR